MAAIAPPLFDWDAVEARSDLERFYRVRDHLPNQALIQALEARRGQVRDNYTVIATWNAVGECGRRRSRFGMSGWAG